VEIVHFAALMCNSEMSKFRKHSIEEKRTRSKARKQRKKLARKCSELCSDQCKVNAREPLVLMQNQSAENGGQDDDNSTGKQPSH